MVKGLIDENNLINIADAIREKTGENGVYYPFEMANAIMNIPTGGGGLELTTSLVLSSDVETTSGAVVLSALLKANYDDLTPADIDLDGFLKNAPVKLYDSNDTLLDTALTDSDGVVIFNETITEDTTFYAKFDGTSDYNSCESNEVTIEYQSEIIIYQPLLDGTEAKTGSINVGNGEMSITNSWGYLTDGFNNTGNWILEADIKYTRNDCLFFLGLPNKTRTDYQECFLMKGGEPYIHFVSKSDSTHRNATFQPSCDLNIWYHVKITKNNNTMTLDWDNQTDSIIWDNVTTSNILCIGLHSWGGMCQAKNIKVTEIGGEQTLFYDKCDDTTDLSNYGTSIKMENGATTSSITHISGNNYNTLTNSSSGSGWNMTPIPNLTGKQCKFSVELQSNTNGAIVISKSSEYTSLRLGYIDNRLHFTQRINGVDEELVDTTITLPANYYKATLILIDTNCYYSISDVNNNVIRDGTVTVNSKFANITDNNYGILSYWQPNKSINFKNVEAISLSGE